MTTIALNKLVAGHGNVRKTGAQDGIEELAASIAAHGLLQSLVVKKAARGKFAVVAGQRRFLALSALAKRDQVPADLPVECRLLEDDADAAEIGLAENVVRVAMHPADQFEAFRDLIDKGSSTADVAARFGVSEAIVAKRLKLGRVSPAILDAFRRGELGLEQVQAFALCDDHAAQERIWEQHRDANPRTIRRALTEGEIPSTDRRARFVGLEAYEAAGGTVRRDLFDEDETGYLEDAALLDRLALEKLEATVETVRAEGWKWAEAVTEFGYEHRAEFRLCYPVEGTLPEAEAAEVKRLEAEHDELMDAQYDGDGEDDPAVTARMEEIAARVSELTEQAMRWTPDQLANADAIITLTEDGEVDIERGLIRPEDVAPRSGCAEAAETADGAEAPAPSLPSTLIADLTAQKTAALRATLARRPDVALAAVTHALARSVFYTYGGDTCLEIRATHRKLTVAMAKPDESSGLVAFDAEHARWSDRLPANADDLFAWCLTQPRDTLLDLLAVSAAHAIDAVRDKGANPCRLQHSEALAKALGFDIATWFTPTAETFFGRVNRAAIMDALTEAGLPARTRAWSKLRKRELATLAEREIAGTGWLPQPLRPLTPDDAHTTADSVFVDEVAG